MAKRFIDAEIAEKIIAEMAREPNYQHEGENWKSGLGMATSAIEKTPTADVVEVRYGRWTLHTDGSGTCSECGTTQKNVWDCDRWQNYCGHCGARMDGDAE